MIRHRRARTSVGIAVLAISLAVHASPAAAGTMAEDARTAMREIVFPVIELQRYRDNFQECRDRCARLHEGTDVFGPRHSPLVATRDATVVRTVTNTVDGGIYGNIVLLRDDDGWTYLYSHLNNDRPGTDDGSNPPGLGVAPGIEPGVRVTAGQLIGYVGDSGNAERSVPHVHFEIHNPDGEFINPYRSLVHAARLSAPLDQTSVPAGDRAYLEALGRDFTGAPIVDVPRAAALDLLRTSGGRPAVVRGLPRSEAWLRTEITRIYQSAFDRAPDEPGLRAWVAAVRGGMSLGAAQAAFLASDEYRLRFGDTDEKWLESVYGDLLGRPADPEGRRHWTDVLARGGTRAGVASAVRQSPEGRGIRVDRLYERLLHRDADDEGRRYWVDVLAIEDDLVLASRLATSDEYYAKAASS